jgi:hypothetical protein
LSLDTDLFVQQASWLAPQLDDPSRLGVLTWIARRLEPEARRTLLAAFPLHHPEQRRAEVALCSLLRRSIVSHPVRLKPTVDVVRSVDWAETYVRARIGGQPPEPYLSRIRTPMPDRATLGALVTLARSWERLLELAAGDSPATSALRERRRSLQLARATLDRALPRTSFGQRHAERLRRLDETAAQQVAAITAALAFWRRAFGAEKEEDSAALRSLAEGLDDATVTNVDTLLEVTTAISIARAAVQSTRPDWPTKEPWTIASIEERGSMAPRMRLRSGRLICEISKGTPASAPDGLGRRTKIADLLGPWADEALPAIGGRSRSSGRQPDIVLTFWSVDAPERSVFVLADAKRNATGTGESYIRAALEVAATYLMCFGYRMGLKVPSADAGGAISTAMHPGVTLFCRQGTGRPESSAVALLRSGKGVPPVMAFDLVNHMSSRDLFGWQSPTLSAWLGSLGRQAAKVLKVEK